MNTKPFLQCTVCYPWRKSQDKDQRVFDEVLLGKRKDTEGARRLKAVGTWNGYGGKFDPSKDQTMEDCAVRETIEESGGLSVSKEYLVRAGIILFKNPSVDIECHFYFASNVSGEPNDTNEMEMHRWYSVTAVPYEEMMDADRKFLLIHLLMSAMRRGKEFRATIAHDTDMKVVGHTSFEFVDTQKLVA